MKQVFLIVALFATVNIPIFAGDDDKKPVIIDVFNTSDNTEYGDASRSPIRRPALFIEDHTLYFTNSCIGYTLQLVQEDTIVYTYYINSTDDLILPGYLSGTYQIRLVGGSFTFVGEIEL